MHFDFKNAWLLVKGSEKTSVPLGFWIQCCQVLLLGGIFIRQNTKYELNGFVLEIGYVGDMYLRIIRIPNFFSVFGNRIYIRLFCHITTPSNSSLKYSFVSANTPTL